MRKAAFTLPGVALLVILAVSLAAQYTPGAEARAEIALTEDSTTQAVTPTVKSIIILIGDGMGINQTRMAEIFSRQVSGKNNPLTINTIETRGAVTTYSADSEVTDSSSAATAIFGGYKINNGELNVLPNTGKKVFTIGQAAKKAGKTVGAITTTRITHATPAGVYAHTDNRDDENLIAEQLVEFGPDVAMGGGLRHFIPKSEKGSKREDDKDLVKEMKAKGYTYVANAEELKKVDLATTDKLFGLFTSSHMDYDVDRLNVSDLGKEPSLAEMTDTAIKVLEKDPDGFFLMVEGGRIDHACHAHDPAAVIHDVLAFDDAVKVALEYQKAHPDLLVIVTADHETGGLGLGRGTEYALNIPALKSVKNSIEYLNGVIKTDPGRAEEIVQSGLGITLTASEKEMLLKYGPDVKADSTTELKGYEGISEYVSSWMHYTMSDIESTRAKVGWTTYAHTAQPVLVYAVGPRQWLFGGYYDNTDIAKRMASLIGVKLEPPY